MGRLVWLVSFLFICNSAFSQATLSLQGILKKSDGTAVADGDYSLTFNIYSALSGGASLWTETQPTVELSGGIYSVILGSVAPLTIPFNQTYYVGIRVGSAIEMTPRVQLTASPYAFSLIGQSNTFPSTGAVGIGTSAPSSSSSLHLKGAAPSILFEDGTSNSSIVINAGNLEFKRNGSEILQVDGGGILVSGAGTFTTGLTVNVGGSQILTTQSDRLKVSKALDVTGTISGDFGDFKHWSFSTDYGSGNGNQNNWSILANGRVKAVEFNAFSDARLKKDISASRPGDDLATLMRLSVSDYRHIDEVQKGKAFKKGFIAQQVEQVFPEAVTQSPDFVPNIYAMSASAQLVGQKMTVKMNENHGLQVGDEVQTISPAGNVNVFVASVLDEKTVVFDQWANGEQPQIFLYGKKVADCRTVDYDRIHTLNVSATQELAKKVASLEAENATLRAKNGDLQGSIEKFESRMRAIEAKLTN